MECHGCHFYGSYSLKKSPWGVGTIMAFAGRISGIVRALEELPLCGFIAEELRDGRTAGYDMMDRGNCDCG